MREDVDEAEEAVIICMPVEDEGVRRIEVVDEEDAGMDTNLGPPAAILRMMMHRSTAVLEVVLQPTIWMPEMEDHRQVNGLVVVVLEARKPLARTPQLPLLEDPTVHLHHLAKLLQTFDAVASHSNKMISINN